MLSWKNKQAGAFSLYLTLLFVCILTSFEAEAQREVYAEDNPPLKERMYYGGNFNLQFGTITFIDVSPLVGVMVTERFSSGVGVTYQYFNDRRFAGGNSNAYGGRVFSRYNIFPNIFAYGEYEMLSFDHFNLSKNEFERIWSPGLLLGAGYFAPFGLRGGTNFMLLYNILHDNQRSVYNNPLVIRVGFVF